MNNDLNSFIKAFDLATSAMAIGNLHFQNFQ